jgi:beta-glucosidase
MESWYDHPNVTAIIYAGLPGQESGNALLDVLLGTVNP